MNKKKKRKGFNRSSMRCPYCGSPVIYRSADGIYRDNSRGTIKNRFSEDQLERHIQTTEGDDSPLLVSAKGGDSIAR